MLVHHGNPYAGQLYVTNIPISPLGIPATYYARLIVTKVPLAVLGAAFAGGIEMIRRRHERGFVFLRVLLLFLLVPYSLMAAKFLRYALPMFAVVDVMAGVGFVSGVAWLLRKGWLPRQVRVATACAATAVLIVDSKANAEQRDALVAFAKNQAPDLLTNVVSVKSAPIALVVEKGNIHGGAARLSLDSVARQGVTNGLK